jgi:hypothetical protein
MRELLPSLGKPEYVDVVGLAGGSTGTMKLPTLLAAAGACMYGEMVSARCRIESWPVGSGLGGSITVVIVRRRGAGFNDISGGDCLVLVLSGSISCCFSRGKAMS